MKYVFLGGAGEVGASCLLISVADRKILIDCGMRISSGDHYPALPNFLLLKELAPKLDAIFISHAHADHVGALPVLHQYYPETSIYMTNATQELAFTMLNNFARSQSEVSYYTPTQVGDALGAENIKIYEEGCQVKDWMKIEDWGDDWAYAMARSGHILGAVSIYLKTPEGKFLYTGDVSAFNQRTVDAHADMSGTNPDFMWCEATYGDKEHPSRSTEERNLVNEVAAVIESGGTVLIPSFALGRAQEIILILKNAMENQIIPKFPVYIDGLVNQICQLYSRHALIPGLAGKYLRNCGAEVLRKQSKKKYEHIFYSKSIRPVHRGGRASILKDTTPKCIIASSGMLNGGASVEYAKTLAPGAKNAIFLSGYQDAESPGRRLQELQQGDELTFADNDVVEVNCQIKRFYLSAHSDRSQLIKMIRLASPKALALVHGEETAIHSLREKLKEDFSVAAPINELPENDTANPEWERYTKPTIFKIHTHIDGSIALDLKSKEHEKQWSSFLKKGNLSAVLQGDILIIKVDHED
jgi:Cft2 family RNA processing exonuclease